MNTFRTLVQAAALTACFAAYVATSGEVHLTGLRRAMQTAAGTLNPPVAAMAVVEIG
jgi:hypothetical protein